MSRYIGGLKLSKQHKLKSQSPDCKKTQSVNGRVGGAYAPKQWTVTKEVVCLACVHIHRQKRTLNRIWISELLLPPLLLNHQPKTQIRTALRVTPYSCGIISTVFGTDSSSTNQQTHEKLNNEQRVGKTFTRHQQTLSFFLFLFFFFFFFFFRPNLWLLLLVFKFF